MSLISLSPITLYLLKVTLISAVLSGYYQLFLRNAAFHPYNRFYLLSATAASLLFPLLTLPAAWSGHAPILLPAGPIVPGPLLPGAAQPHPDAHAFVNWPLPGILYLVIAALFLLRLVPPLLHISRLTRKYPPVRMKDVRFYPTDEPGTPFSFGARLFWNNRIPLDTPTGQAILHHEMTHIRQKHTLDILTLETLRCLFWINPIFHWTLREIRVIHEFLADRDALASGGDPGRYAECLVWQSAGAGGNTSLRHSFFHTHLKRRITLLIQTNPARPRYLGRLLAIPLLFLLFSAFAVPKTAAPADPKTLLRFYNKHLRYPQDALAAGKEGKVWFSVKVGANGNMTDFQPASEATLGGHNPLKITVTSRPAANTTSAAPPKEVFLDEVMKASKQIGEDKNAAIPPGEYYLVIVFAIEHH